MLALTSDAVHFQGLEAHGKLRLSQLEAERNFQYIVLWDGVVPMQANFGPDAPDGLQLVRFGNLSGAASFVKPHELFSTQGTKVGTWELHDINCQACVACKLFAATGSVSVGLRREPGAGLVGRPTHRWLCRAGAQDIPFVCCVLLPA